MNSAEAQGTFAAHLYGPNGAITSGASRTGIIGDPYDFLPSATMPKLPESAQYYKDLYVFIVLPDGSSIKHIGLTFPFLYISVCTNFVV